MSEEGKDILKNWNENYTGFLKMWGDSHAKLYRPWIESMGELSDKAARIAQDAVPDKYKEFYEEWVEIYDKTYGKLYPLHAQKSNKEILDKFLSSAEESNKLYRSWIADLEENIKNTRELMEDTPDPEKYAGCYNMWIKSYDRMFDEFLVQPAFESAAEIFGNIPGTPNIYRETYKHILKIWKDSYIRQYKPYIESMFKLSAKIAEISKGGANLTEYKEFHNLWMNMYHDSFGKLIDENSIGTSKEVFEHFLHSTTVYLNMYKSWITALEKMSEKGIELSNSTGPEAYREFCDLWIKTYQKAFESFFEDMPMIGPMKETMEPVKVAARTYSNMLVEMSNIWKDSTFNPAGRN